MMYDREKSDAAIVAAKLTNNAGACIAAVAESVEPRAATKRNVEEQSTHRTLGRDDAYGKLQGNERRRSSPHSITMSALTCSGSHSLRSSAMLLLA